MKIFLSFFLCYALLADSSSLITKDFVEDLIYLTTGDIVRHGRVKQ